MNIIDTFPYFNEKELLELRINLLNDYVDKFIIIDADHTHQGKPKPFTCKNTLKELGLFNDKIEVIELNLPSCAEEHNPWIRERMQRDIAAQFISENDVAIISDCDEIMDPNCIKHYVHSAKLYPDSIIRIPMVLLNCRADLAVYYENNELMICFGSFVCLKHHLCDYSLSTIRESYTLATNIKYKNISTTTNNILNKGGWHFSWMGDYNRLKDKSEAFAHNEINLINKYFAEENSTDPLGRVNHILKKYDISNLPQKIFELPRVKNFLLPEKTN